MKKIVLSESNMCDYFKDKFDPIAKKYHRYLTEESAEEYAKKYLKCQEYEDNRQFSELTKKKFGDIQANLHLVYADEKRVERIVDIYETVYYKVIGQYINIDGLERLFSENYINFEWEMHMGIDYKKHSMSFYRDHFIHQVRNAYTMDLLLQNGYLETVKGILKNEGNSKISRYVCKYVRQQMEKKNNVIAQLLETDMRKDEEKQRARDFYLENIIYMSSYMSGLFHDIGYPEVANMKSGRNIVAYIANVYNFGTGYLDFDRIVTILQNSLLFRVVSLEEIKERVEDEKIDHGAVSALMFLLHFYENGAIFGLEPYKKCAIELAGLAIYNHTNEYAYIKRRDTDKNKDDDDDDDAIGKNAYESCVLTLNPISYLLRICDDLQEWERIYFEISDQSNMIECTSCHTPLVRRKLQKEETVYYLCNCNSEMAEEREKDGVFEPLFRRNNFPYRRLYNITVCKEMIVTVDKQRKNYVFNLNYDLEKVLQAAYINPSYAQHRTKDLNQIKKLFVRQKGIGKSYINYFLTPNILLIKAKIVSEYLQKVKKYSFSGIWNVIKAILSDITVSEEERAKKVHEKLQGYAKNIYEGRIKPELFQKERKSEQLLLEYTDENFHLYIYLALVMNMGESANRKDSEIYNIGDVLSDIYAQFKKTGCENYTEDVWLMLQDCFLQADKLYRNIEEHVYYPDKYFEQFQSKKYMKDCFGRFANPENYMPVKQRSFGRMELDAYTDLHCFKIMLYSLREWEKERCSKK